MGSLEADFSLTAKTRHQVGRYAVVLIVNIQVALTYTAFKINVPRRATLV